MAIVKMKKLRLAALGSQQSDLMYELQRLGCVELRPCEAPEGYLTPDSGGSYWSKYIGNCAVYRSDLIDGRYTVPEEFLL